MVAELVLFFRLLHVLNLYLLLSVKIVNNFSCCFKTFTIIYEIIDRGLNHVFATLTPTKIFAKIFFAQLCIHNFLKVNLCNEYSL